MPKKTSPIRYVVALSPTGKYKGAFQSTTETVKRPLRSWIHTSGVMPLNLALHWITHLTTDRPEAEIRPVESPRTDATEQ